MKVIISLRLFQNIKSVNFQRKSFCSLFLESFLTQSSSLLVRIPTVLPAKSDSDVMFCLQSYKGLIIDRSLVY